MPKLCKQINRASQGVQRDGSARLAIVLGFHSFTGLGSNKSKTRTELLQTYARRRKVACRSLERWLAKYRQSGAAALVDGRYARKVENERFSPEAFAVFKNAYLTRNKPSLKTCWAFVRFLNRTEKHGWAIPGLRRVQEYVRREIPEQLRCLCREGRAAAEAKYGKYVTELVIADYRA